MLAEGHDVKSGPVFVTRTGNFIGKSNLVRHVHRPLLKRAKLPIRKFHVLRHTHASTLLARGRNIREVSERLGHSNPELTLRVYAHLMQGTGKETAKVLERFTGWYSGYRDAAGGEESPAVSRSYLFPGSADRFPPSRNGSLCCTP
jgi:hypothetical protein